MASRDLDDAIAVLECREHRGERSSERADEHIAAAVAEAHPALLRHDWLRDGDRRLGGCDPDGRMVRRDTMDTMDAGRALLGLPFARLT